MALRQRELTLLRRLVDVTNSLKDDQSIEFVVDSTTEGTFAWFIWASGALPEIRVAMSDINELVRQGYLLHTGYSGSDPTYQVTHEALGLFRQSEVMDIDARMSFDTGDRELDELLDSAETKYKLSDAQARRDALEKLWDAWERLKTLGGKEKPKALLELMDAAAPEPNFRALLDAEATALTTIGNKYRQNDPCWNVVSTTVELSRAAWICRGNNEGTEH